MNRNIKLIRQQKVINGKMDTIEISMCQLITHQSDVNIGKRFVSSFGTRAIQHYSFNPLVGGKNLI